MDEGGVLVEWKQDFPARSENKNSLLKAQPSKRKQPFTSKLIERARKRKKRLKLKIETLECPLCQSLLFEPITTSCGHTFCRSCILRVMDHTNKCPLCRTIIYVTPEHGISILIQSIIQENFPQQLNDRKQEIQQELKMQKFNLPLFLLGDTILFPHMSLPLHVFEPRYRLMVRRCLEGGRRFGIVPTLNGQLCEVGTTAVIENHWILPDGRSLIATVGDSRFKVNSVWDQDGYKVAQVDYIQDDPLTEEDQPLVDQYFAQVREFTQSKFSEKTLHQIQEKLGRMPSNPSEFAWWLSYVLPVPVEKKNLLLRSNTLLARLRLLSQYMQELDLSAFENPPKKDDPEESSN